MAEAISLAGMVAAFALAYGCDRWIESLRAEATRNFTIASFLWQAGLANLLLAAALLLLAWYVLVRVIGIKWVPAVLLLAGLAVTFLMAIEMSVAATLPPLGIAEFLTPNSHVLFAAAFVAVIGLAGLVLPRRLTP